VFVHGCFWHRHGCSRTTTPATQVDFWTSKFARNVERDRANEAALRRMGWRVLVVWECGTQDTKALHRRLSRHFSTVSIRR
jgi:DNA mismatch endonuclease (patch repair protein)